MHIETERKFLVRGDSYKTSATAAHHIRQGYIAYVINTRDINSGSQATDGAHIRSLATENGVSLFTALDTVRILLDVLEETTITVSLINDD